MKLKQLALLALAAGLLFCFASNAFAGTEYLDEIRSKRTQLEADLAKLNAQKSQITAPGAKSNDPAALSASAEAEALDSKIESKKKELEKLDEEEDSYEDFISNNFGIGLSATVDLGSHDRIKSAGVVNGVVRVEEDDDVNLRVMLELHRFMYTSKKDGRFGIGPFVGVQNGEDHAIEAFALGVMFGFRYPGETKSLNIGFGGVVDPSVQILGDGLEADQPLPKGESEIRYKTTEQWGVICVTSFTW